MLVKTTVVMLVKITLISSFQIVPKLHSTHKFGTKSFMVSLLKTFLYTDWSSIWLTYMASYAYLNWNA